jgi:DNA-binding MarR family transcriptional regulator
MNQARRTNQATGRLVLDLLQVAEMIDERLNAALEPQGLSLAKFGVLQSLVHAGEPLPLGVLSERLGCVKSNVTQLVDRLEADDLVHRIPDPQDRRSKLAAITDEGQKRYEAGQRALDNAQQEVLTGIPERELHQLASVLGRFGQQGRD